MCYTLYNAYGRQYSSVLNAVANGDSARQAALKCGVLRATIQYRVKGHLSHHKGAQHMQKIAPTQEKQSAD